MRKPWRVWAVISSGWGPRLPRTDMFILLLTCKMLCIHILLILKLRTWHALRKNIDLKLLAIAGGFSLTQYNAQRAKFNEHIPWLSPRTGPSFTTIIHPFFFFYSFLSQSPPPPVGFCVFIGNPQRRHLSFSPPKTRAINLLQWEPSARQWQGYSRLLSLLTSTQRPITYRQGDSEADTWNKGEIVAEQGGVRS